MSKPLIGVMPLWDEGKKSIWMLPGYLEGILSARDQEPIAEAA